MTGFTKHSLRLLCNLRSKQINKGKVKTILFYERMHSHHLFLRGKNATYTIQLCSVFMVISLISLMLGSHLDEPKNTN